MTTPRTAIFFFGLFSEAQRECKLVFDDYLALLESLPFMLENIEAGAPPMQETITVCQLLWAKTPEQNHVVEQIVRRFALNALQAYQREMIALRNSTEKPIKDRADLERRIREMYDALEASKPAAPVVPKHETISEPREANILDIDEDVFDEEGDEPAIAESPALEPDTLVELPEPSQNWKPILPPPPPERRPLLPKAVALETMPVTALRLKHFWRMCRLPQRGGVPSLFSLRRTMATLERHGGLPVPAYEPAMMNKIGLLLLVDCGAHMVTYERQTRLMAQTLAASPFSYRQTVYFDTVPLKLEAAPPAWTLYKDEKCKIELKFDDIFTRLAYASIMIVSDAGQASSDNRFADEYHDFMGQFVALLGTWGTNVVWLNPRHESKWGLATNRLAAQLKACLESRFVMLPYTDTGIEAAVKHLRGYASL